MGWFRRLYVALDHDPQMLTLVATGKNGDFNYSAGIGRSASEIQIAGPSSLLLSVSLLRNLTYC